MFDTTFDRRTSIGASDAAAILHLNPYEGEWDVFLRKTGQSVDDDGSSFTRAGDALEPLIGQLYSERTGDVLEPCQTRRHPDYPMISATPDWAVVGSPRLVEAKAVLSPGVMRQYGDEASGVFPAHHALQALVQMACFNRDETALAAFVGGQLRIYRIERDKDTERLMCDQLAAWWEAHIVKGDPPAVDGTPAVRDYLLRKFPKHGGGMLVADDLTARQMMLLFDIRRRKDEAEATEEKIKNILSQIIADKDGIEAPGIGRVTWKRTKDTRKTDWDSVANTLAKFAPEGEFDRIVEMHTTTKPGTRRFVMTEDEKDG